MSSYLFKFRVCRGLHSCASRLVLLAPCTLSASSWTASRIREKNYMSRNSVGMKKRDWNVLPGVAKQLHKDVLQKPSYAQTTFLNHEFQQSFQSKIQANKDKNVMLSNLGITEIEDVLCEIAHSESPLSHMSQVRLIEEECCNRMPDLTIKSMLYIADILFCINYRATRFMRACLSNIEQKWHTLKPTIHETIQLLFYIGVFRRCPEELSMQIEQDLVDHISHLSGNELGLVCHAFFTSNMSFQNPQLLDKLARACIRELSYMKHYMIGNILKSMRHADYRNSDFYRNIGNQIAEMDLENFSLATLMHIASCFSGVRMCHEYLFSSLSTRLKHLVKSHGHELRTKDLTRLLWAYGNLQHPALPELMNTLLASMEKNTVLWDQFPEVFVECLLSLAMQEVYPHALINHAFSHNFQQMKKHRVLEQDYQMLLLDTAVSIESPTYGGNRLPEDFVNPSSLGSVDHELRTRQGLAVLLKTLTDLLGSKPGLLTCGFTIQHSKIAEIQLELDERHQPCVQTFRRQKENVPVMLERVLAEKSVSGQKSSHSVISTLLAAQPTRQCKNIENFHNVPSTKTDRRRVLIKVYSHNQYAVNEPVLLGIPQMELRLLNKLGYEVFGISPSYAEQLENMVEAEREASVRTSVIQKLGIKL